MWQEGWEADSLWVPQDSGSLRPWVPFQGLPALSPSLSYFMLSSPKTEVRTDGQVCLWPALMLNKMTLSATLEL